MKPWSAVDAHNGGVEAQNRVVKGLDRRFAEEQDPWIRTRKVKSLIRIRIKVKKGSGAALLKKLCGSTSLYLSCTCVLN
jgi:hypothetical protein